MTARLVIVNGGSSSGKTGIVRCLQAVLDEPRLAFSVDVFLGGAGSQQRWRDAIGDVETVWVGVRCEPEVAAGREIARGDRVGGMAASQATEVHEGVRYDVEVDTTHTESIVCARVIAAHIAAG